MSKPAFPTTERDVRYCSGSFVQDAFIRGLAPKSPGDDCRTRPASTDYIRCAYIGGRIVESFSVSADVERLMERYWYSDKHEPVLKVEYLANGTIGGLQWADYDSSSRPVRIVSLHRSPAQGYQLRGTYLFQYIVLGTEKELIVRTSYRNDGLPQGQTIWIEKEVWMGTPNSPFRKVNYGSREDFVRYPERFGLAPFYPLPKQQAASGSVPRKE